MVVGGRTDVTDGTYDVLGQLMELRVVGSNGSSCADKTETVSENS